MGGSTFWVKPTGGLATVAKKRRKQASKNRAPRKPAKTARTSRVDPVGTRPARSDSTDRQSNAAEIVPALAARGTTAGSTRLASRTTTASAPTERSKADEKEPASAGLTVAESQDTSGGWAGLLDDREPQGLAATYWFDAPESGAPAAVAVRFTGIRVGVKGMLKKGDRFERVERVEGIPAGSGRVAITTRRSGLNAGEWRVTAKPVEQSGFEATTPKAARSATRLPTRTLTVRTRFAQLTYGPEVRLGSWPALVALGAVAAIVIQALLIARAGLSVGSILAVSAIATGLGFVGGKAYYLILKRKHPREFLKAGACIQGFLIVALGVVGIAALVFGFPVGTVLDATAPGVFLGMAIGRPGCFLTGCCSGRPTGSRWGLPSSDRRVLTRRYPVQLIEACMALLIGGVALLVVLVVEPPIPGAVFAGALAAYTFGRQLLFPLRADSHTRIGRVVTMALCGLVVVGAVVASVVA